MPLSALRLWKVVKGRSLLGLWLNHRTQALFYIGAWEAQLPPKPRPCSPNISAYRCKKEHSVAFKIYQNAFPAGALPRTPMEELTYDTPPNSLVGWEGDMILPPSALTTKTRHLGLVGGTAHDGTSHFTDTLLLGTGNMKPARPRWQIGWLCCCWQSLAHNKKA